VHADRDSGERYVKGCEILSNDEVATGQYRMQVHAPEMAHTGRPGQFCMLAVSEGIYPFLRRPMCFERFSVDGFSILYTVEGEGTRLLSRMARGETISVQGPLGQGFPIDSGFTRHILVAGGIGVAPFPGLADGLVNTLGVRPEIILAARTKDVLVCEEDFREMECEVHVATDDGSAGTKALAPAMLEQLAPGPETRVYVCGPTVMMARTAEAALAAGANCLVSLEAHMACGDGACLGCVVPSSRGNGSTAMVRVCVDGPVFDAAEINWEALDAIHDD